MPPMPSTLVDVVAAEGGRVTFARFMESALTHPTLGYYSRVDRLLRQGGDFSTAPALSPFFNRTVARLITELVDAALSAGLENAEDVGPIFPRGGGLPSVVELGGGEGQMASAVLDYWEAERPQWRETIVYRIVELGTGLRQRQAAALDLSAAAGWKVGWGTGLEEASAGTRPVVVIGNEFLDAIPVHMIHVDGDGLREAYVEVVRTDLEQTWGEVSREAADELCLLFETLDPRLLLPLTEDGVIEVFPGLSALLAEVDRVMPAGSLVSIDYGDWFPGVRQTGERWGLEGRASRRRTVRGFFKHQMVSDPLARAGRQDLTADVDFAAVDAHGRRWGFETVLFTTLSRFLRGGGAEDELTALRGIRPVVCSLSCSPSIPTATDSPGAAAVSGDSANEDEPSTDYDRSVAGHGLDPLEADRQATVLESLLDERDLGGVFKVMLQVREQPGTKE